MLLSDVPGCVMDAMDATDATDGAGEELRPALVTRAACLGT